MPKTKREVLTELRIRAIKPGTKPIKVTDGQGLYLLVTPNGSKLWRMGFVFAGRNKSLSFGEYPLISLKEARNKRDEARRLLKEGHDPAAMKQAKKAARVADENTFEVIAREWHLRNSGIWTPLHCSRIIRWLEKDVFPYIGDRAIKDLNAPDVLTVCRRIEKRTVYTAHRLLQIIGAVFRYAVATGRAVSDPSGALKGALAPHREKNHATLVDPKAIGELLRAMDGYHGDPVTRAALRLTPLVMLRPGELRHLEWGEIDLDAPEIRIPAGKMKMRSLHVVPLSRQAVAVLREVQCLTGEAKHVFPSARKDGRPMSENTVRSALIRLGYTGEEQTAHGFRAMASTILNEQGFHRRFSPVAPDHRRPEMAKTSFAPPGEPGHRMAE
ncbi:MAG: integrase arm-type DNA-binding domain-containing protein [Acidobacteria bacterium]|nr:integrase arm-type DNA-binding domain-containing protein [Acidobacteriota bacterium]